MMRSKSSMVRFFLPKPILPVRGAFALASSTEA